MGVSQGASDIPCDAPCDVRCPCAAPMMGGVTYDCKTPLNIYYLFIYIIFFENIGQKYDFEGGWGGPW